MVDIDPTPLKMVRATKALFAGRTRAHNAGDLLPAKHAEKYYWTDDVEPVETDVFDPGAHSIPEVLAYVGDDTDRALEVLEAEEGRGSAARSTLVEQLEAVAVPPQA